MWKQATRVGMEVDDEGEPEEEYDEGTQLRKELDEVSAAFKETEDQQAAIAGYRKVLDYESADSAGPSDSVSKVKEEAIYALTKTYADARR